MSMNYPPKNAQRGHSLRKYVEQLSQDLREIKSKPVPLQRLTESEKFFDVISKGSRIPENRPILYIVAAKELFMDSIISNIGFVRSRNKLAEVLTKLKSQAALRNLI